MKTENHNNIIMFAFRYGLERKTGAPLMVSNYIRANINELNDKDVREIISDIERWKPIQISSDWLDLLDFLKKRVAKLDQKF